MDAAFNLKDALVDATKAAVAAAAPGTAFDGTEVHESWPNKGLQGSKAILFLDFDGDEVPATMRAGGGTRDATIRYDVVVAVTAYENDPRLVRAATKPLIDEFKKLVRGEGAVRPGGAFGVAGVRMPAIRSFRVVEFVLDQGRRECDVHFSLEFVARVSAS